MIIVIVAASVGFYMAFGIGANDGANSMAAAVGSKSIVILWALILAAICEFCGAVFVGSHVSNTIRKGIVDVSFFTGSPELLARGMVCSLLASAIWLQIASMLGMPVSTTHSIVGAIVGFSLIAAGIGSVNWGKMAQIVASWFVSPIAGGLIAYVIFKSISKNILGKKNPLSAAGKGVPIVVFMTFTTIILATILKGLHLDLNTQDALIYSIIGGGISAAISFIIVGRIIAREGNLNNYSQLVRVEKIFVPIVIITSSSVAFAHGANDVSNAIGPLAAAIEIINTNDVPKQVNVDFWILVLGGAGIAIGLIAMGKKVIETVGDNITDLTPSRGVAAALSTTMTVLTCTKIGLPISTTHTLVGAVLGVGFARGLTAINIDVVKPILLSWFVTVPFTGIVAALIFSVWTWVI